MARPSPSSAADRRSRPPSPSTARSTTSAGCSRRSPNPRDHCSGASGARAAGAISGAVRLNGAACRRRGSVDATTPLLERSQWDHISLATDIELHVRRPLPRSLSRKVDRLVTIARELLEEDPS